MKTVKAETVVSQVNGTMGFSTEVEGQKELQHFIPSTEIREQVKYQQLISKNHPEYDFTPVLMTPEVEQLKASTSYQTEELKNAFIIDEVQFKQQPATAEQVSNPQINNNPLKTETMENQAQTTVNAQAEPVQTVSTATKAKYYGRCTAGVGVKVITVPTHATLQTLADVFQLSANAVRNTEAFLIDKLDIKKATREELRNDINDRTIRIQQVVFMPITIPMGIIQGVKMSIKNPVTPSIQTA